MNAVVHIELVARQVDLCKESVLFEGVVGDYWVEPWPMVGAKLATGQPPALPNLLAFDSASTAENVTGLTVMQANGGGAVRIGAVTDQGYAVWSPDGTLTGCNTKDAGLVGVLCATEIDPESGTLFAKNPYNTEFSDRVAFFYADKIKKTYT